MSKDFEEKTSELIDLADNGLSENTKSVDGAAAPVIDVPDVTKRKKGKAGKVILAIVGVLLALLLVIGGTGFGLLSCATKDEMPAAPAAVEVDMAEFALGAVTEIIKDSKITLDADFVNSVLGTVKESVNGSTDMIRIDDLFCQLENSTGKLYARVFVGTLDLNGFKLPLNKTFPVEADFDIEFDEAKNIVIILDDIYCGKFKIPQTVIDAVLAQVQLPEAMTISPDGNILYDTTGLDAMIDDAMTSTITSSVSGAFGELLAGFASNLTDVELTGADIDGENIIINGSIF